MSPSNTAGYNDPPTGSLINPQAKQDGTNATSNRENTDGLSTKGQNSDQDTPDNTKRQNALTSHTTPESDLLSNEDNDKVVDVSNQIKELWAQEAAKDLGYVPLKKLTTADIISLRHGRVDWENIDPYSSLEEESEKLDTSQSQSGSKDLVIPKQEQPTDNKDNIIGTVYFMRERKTLRHSTKPLRQNRNIVNYSQMDRTSDSCSPRQLKKKPAVPSAPSAARISAQWIISATPAQGNQIPPVPVTALAKPKRFARKDLSKSKPIQCKPNTNQDNYMEADTEDAPDPLLADSQPTQPSQLTGTSKPNLKGAFKTTKHSLVKRK